MKLFGTMLCLLRALAKDRPSHFVKSSGMIQNHDLLERLPGEISRSNCLQRVFLEEAEEDRETWFSYPEMMREPVRESHSIKKTEMNIATWKRFVDLSPSVDDRPWPQDLRHCARRASVVRKRLQPGV